MTTPSPEEAARAIKAFARDLRFDACGIAPAAQPIDPENHLGAWLDQGFQAGMEWIRSSRAIRRDIQARLPGARSVIVVARDYWARRPEPREGSARVSRYAWGRDYHRVLRKPLKRLADFLGERVPGQTSWFGIDSGTVMEKAWAARAGIGWIGKHSLLIHPGLGSWVFLGLLATTADLAPDAPMPDQCGACTACLEACPTAALVRPRVLDARRCLAYHTVESREDLPPDLAPCAGDWLFGCDACQEACPYNPRETETDEIAFHPREGLANPDPGEVAAMDDETFAERFTGSPVMRAKREGLVRTARAILSRRTL